VYSRDTLGDLGPIEQLLDDDSTVHDSSDGQKDARTPLNELRFVPGDFLCVAVMLPKNIQATFSDPSALKSPSGTSPSAPVNGWKSGRGLGCGGPNGPSGPGGSAGVYTMGESVGG
jgi:histone deacetylase complex subunit SAP18